ncbi:MAG: alpha/beta hydrolase [Clostridia bacterium]|nr:alpha/beta hydrolase [Clostridia bacterium]
MFILLIAAGLLILLIALSFYFLRFALVRSRRPGMWSEPPESAERHARFTERAMTLHHERLRITSHDGLRLCGYFFPAERPTAKTVICIHGYRADGLHDHAVNLLWHHHRGYNVLLPDNRAHGDSEGKLIGFGWQDRLDIRGWCGLLRERGCGEILLHGVSMGSAAALCAAGGEGIEGLRGVIADCPYTSGFEQFAHVTKTMLHLPRFPLLYTTTALARLVCGWHLRDCSPIDAARTLTVPLLLIHGDSDDFVPTEMAYRLDEACREAGVDCTLLIVSGARHAASAEVSPQEYYGAVERFLEKVRF